MGHVSVFAQVELTLKPELRKHRWEQMILPAQLNSQVTSGRLLICIKRGKPGATWDTSAGLCGFQVSPRLLIAPRRCLLRAHAPSRSDMHFASVAPAWIHCEHLTGLNARACVLLLFQQRRQLHSWVAKEEIEVQFRVCQAPGYYLVVIYCFWGLSCSHKLRNDSVNSSLMLNALTGTTHPTAELWESNPHCCLTAQSDPAHPTQPYLPPFVQVRFSSCAPTCFYSCHSIQTGKV